MDKLIVEESPLRRAIVKRIFGWLGLDNHLVAITDSVIALQNDRKHMRDGVLQLQKLLEESQQQLSLVVNHYKGTIDHVQALTFKVEDLEMRLRLYETNVPAIQRLKRSYDRKMEAYTKSNHPPLRIHVEEEAKSHPGRPDEHDGSSPSAVEAVSEGERSDAPGQAREGADRG